MFTKYEEYELLEFFQKEPVYIGGKETGICIYTCTDEHAFNLTLSLSIYECKCDISLDYKNKIIFNFCLKNVSNLESKDGTLKIYRGDNDRTFIIRFDTIFTLTIENV